MPDRRAAPKAEPAQQDDHSIIARDGDAFVVPARLLAKAFGLTEEAVRREMRNGAITSRAERGADADEGRWRLTFHRQDRACRFVVDDAGAILTQAAFPVRARDRDPAAPEPPSRDDL